MIVATKSPIKSTPPTTAMALMTGVAPEEPWSLFPDESGMLSDSSAIAF